MEATAMLDCEGPGLLRELAALDIEVDGVEALHQLVAEILGQISTQDAWAGRAPALEAPHACAGCGRWQQVRVPFLHHACESCKCLWVPGHCSRCGRTAAMPLSEFEGTLAPRCGCGANYKRLSVLPLQPVSENVTVEQETLTFSKATTRRAGLMVRMSSVAAALVALAAAVAIGMGHGTTAAPTTAPISHRTLVALANSPAQHGAAMGVRLRAAGLPTTPFACDAALSQSSTSTTVGASVPTADRVAFVNACIG